MNQGVDIQLKILQTLLSLVTNFGRVHGELLGDVSDPFFFWFGFAGVRGLDFGFQSFVGVGATHEPRKHRRLLLTFRARHTDRWSVRLCARSLAFTPSGLVPRSRSGIVTPKKRPPRIHLCCLITTA